jgi:hypothetical protein
MERYVFFDPDRVPPGLPVIGVPPPNGFVWMEITADEYQAAIVDLETARQLAVYAAEVLADRLSRSAAHQV